MANHRRSSFGFVKTMLLAGAILSLAGFMSFFVALSEIGVKTMLLGIFVFLMGICGLLIHASKRTMEYEVSVGSG